MTPRVLAALAATTLLAGGCTDDPEPLPPRVRTARRSQRRTTAAWRTRARAAQLALAHELRFAACH